jgi:hypothetical protein
MMTRRERAFAEHIANLVADRVADRVVERLRVLLELPASEPARSSGSRERTPVRRRGGGPTPLEHARLRERLLKEARELIEEREATRTRKR